MGYSPQNKVLEPEWKVGFQDRHLPHPAPKLYRDRDRIHNSLDNLFVDRFALYSAIQVDKMKPLGAAFMPSYRHLLGDIRKNGLIWHPPLFEPYTAALFDVNSRDNKQMSNPLLPFS